MASIWWSPEEMEVRMGHAMSREARVHGLGGRGRPVAVERRGSRRRGCR
jgi:hypothetical protein